MQELVKAENLSLDVPTYLQRDRRHGHWHSVFFGAMFDRPRRQSQTLLKDFTFTIREGDRMALLGQNGAGKSTLLKVLSGAYAPTSGNLSVNGTVHSLINMNLGFHKQATVRENIFLRGTAMGLSTDYIRQHVDEILAFADIPETLNQRLYTLSTGQKMRLGLAISTSVQQDILLLDEWIGTGDANFRSKARERLMGKVDGSKVVVLASHQAGLLRSLCNRGMVIDYGRLLYVGDIESALAFYQKVLALQWTRGTTRDIDFSVDKPLVYGYVDHVTMQNPGAVQLKGWMASTHEQRPEALILRLGNELHQPGKIRRYKRADVVKRFGVSDAECGFEAVFEISGLEDLCALEGMEVLGGPSGAQPETVLRQSDRVHMAIATGMEA